MPSARAGQEKRAGLEKATGPRKGGIAGRPGSRPASLTFAFPSRTEIGRASVEERLRPRLAGDFDAPVPQDELVDRQLETLRERV